MPNKENNISRKSLFEAEVGKILSDTAFTQNPHWNQDSDIANWCKEWCDEYNDMPEKAPSLRLPKKAARKFQEEKDQPLPLPKTKDAIGSEQERRCQQVRISYVARTAAKHREVVDFRRKLPRLLTEEEAWTFITSPLASYFDFKQLQEWGVDLVTAKSTVLSRVKLSLKQRVALSIKRISDGFIQELPAAFEAGAYDDAEIEASEAYNGEKIEVTFGKVDTIIEQALISIESPGGQISERVASYALDAPQMFLAYGRHTGFSYISGGMTTQPAYVDIKTGESVYIPMIYEGEQFKGVRGRLLTIAWQALWASYRLAQEYGWDAQEALRFLLTGKEPQGHVVFAVMPHFNLLEGRGIKGDGAAESEMVWGPINLTVSPWVLPDTLTNFYKGLRPRQNQVNKIPSEGDLDLFEFVNRKREELTEMGIKPTWQNLHDVWAKERPGFKSKGYRNFWRDYRRVKNMLFPPFIEVAQLSE